LVLRDQHPIDCEDPGTRATIAGLVERGVELFHDCEALLTYGNYCAGPGERVEPLVMAYSRLNTSLIAISACLLWSTAFVGIKMGLAYTTPLNFAGARFLIAGLLLLPLAGNPVTALKVVRRHLGFVCKVAVFYTVLLYAFFYLGISLGTASTTAIVVGGGPLFIALLAHLTLPDDKLTAKKGAALVIGMSGIAVIAVSRYRLSFGASSDFFAVLLLVAANLFGGYGNILISKSRVDITPLLLNSAQLVVGGALLLLLSLIFEPTEFSVKPFAYYGALVYLSLLSAAAITLWFTVLRRPEVKVSEINTWKFLIPVFGATLSWLVLPDEHPDAIAVIGMCAIALSLVLINRRPA
jgi:drug/metabolite transporter (DMT)-like permease